MPCHGLTHSVTLCHRNWSVGWLSLDSCQFNSHCYIPSSYYKMACTDFPNIVAQCHIFWGCAPRGLWPPSSNSAQIFVQCTHPQVSSSYVYSFVNYRVDKQTNKQTPLQTSTTFAMLRRWLIAGILLVVIAQRLPCVQCTYPQVSSSCVYSFRSYHKQTNRRCWKHPPPSLHYDVS